VTTKLAYLGLIIIWATTPLAIKWSTEGPGYLFGIAGRMVLGLVVTYIVILFVDRRMPWHRRAVQTYLASGLGIYLAMGSTYWGAQHIPSGWVSVVFGLSPLITGVMAAAWLKEDALSGHKIAGILCGLCGLCVIFGHGAEMGAEFVYGALAVLVGTSFHALSAVLIKRIDAQLGGFAITGGGLSFAVPLLLATWWVAEDSLPASIPTKAALSIVYLGVVASTIGFALYYYVLRRMTVSRVSLIALITPVLALLLGNVLNGEPLSGAVLLGTAGIVIGLLVYEFGASFRRMTGSPEIRARRSRARGNP
jgi:drug/metabolite transporter (DMT)-like permease